MSRRHFSAFLSIPRLLRSYHPLLHNVSWALGREGYKCPTRFEYSIVIYSQYLNKFWVSALTADHCEKKFVWLRSTPALNYSYKQIFRRQFDNTSIQHNNSSASPLEPITSQPWGLVRFTVLAMNSLLWKGLQIEPKVVVITITCMPLLTSGLNWPGRSLLWHTASTSG